MKLRKINNIGIKEKNNVLKVLNSGILSNFVGSPSKYQNGGPNIIKFENLIKKKFDIKNCISINSWSSGLDIAIGSLQLEPGDEIIVTPWTMSANVISILKWNCIPVFCDIESDYFCIDTSKIEKLINKKTKAILYTDIFGQSADVIQINKIAKKYKLLTIADSAQSIGAKYFGKFTGALADIGGYSFNYHKHIHSGEGGALVTNNKKIAENLRLLRNHAENFMTKNSTNNQLINMIGGNYRLCEIEASILLVQMQKLQKIIKINNSISKVFDTFFSKYDFIKIPKIRPGCTHSYYVYGLQIIHEKPQFIRNEIRKFVKKNKFDFVFFGYQNIHLLPIFQKKICYGKNGYPFTHNPSISYQKGICPTSEFLHDSSFFGIEMCKYELNDNTINVFLNKIKKVLDKFL